LLGAQLLPEVRKAAAALLAMLARRVAAALDCAFIGKAFFALQEQFFSLSAALAAFGIKIASHNFFP